MGFDATVDTLFDKSKDLILTWVSVLTRGPKAFEHIDLEARSTQVYALKFLFFVACAEALTTLPLAATADVSWTSPGVAIPFVAETYVEYLAIAVILHGAMRLAGGRGGAAPCVTGFCFLSAYMPVAGIAMIPARLFLTVPALRFNEDFILTVGGEPAYWHQLSTWNRSSVILSLLLTTVVYVLF